MGGEKGEKHAIKKKAKVLNIILIRRKQACDKLLKVKVQVIVNAAAAAAKSLQSCLIL